MAWIDDRIWCHPKIVGLTPQAFRAHIQAIAYSSGMVTGGRLSPSQQKLVGGTPRIRRDLETAGLWDADGDDIVIHDWDEHNGKRDARRKSDRDRKRAERANDPDGWITRSGRWQQTRAEVFARDSGVCVDCGETTEGWHADHVPSRAILRERGDDPFDIRWIETRCHVCHARKHSLERHGKTSDNGRTEVGTDKGQTSRPAHVDGSEGSDGTTLPIPEPELQDAGRAGQGRDLERLQPIVPGHPDDDIDFG